MSHRIEERKEAILSFMKHNPVKPSTACYDMLEKKFPELSRKTHRNFVYFLEEQGLIVRPENKEFTCPHCGIDVKGVKKGEEVFGFRNMHDGIKRIQSWCRECRIRDSKRRYLEGKLKKKELPDKQEKATRRQLQRITSELAQRSQ